MFIDPFDDPSPEDSLRDCLKMAYAPRRSAALPPRMVDLLAQLERREREAEARG